MLCPIPPPIGCLLTPLYYQQLRGRYGSIRQASRRQKKIDEIGRAMWCLHVDVVVRRPTAHPPLLAAYGACFSCLAPRLVNSLRSTE